MKLFFIFGLANTLLASVPSSGLGEKHAKVIKQFGIESNFKGFSYRSPAPDSEEFSIRYVNEVNQTDDFVGLKFTVDNDGKIQEIAPIVEENRSDYNRVIWAVSKFEAGGIGIDSLWEISRSSFPNAVSDVDVFKGITILLKGEVDNFRSIKFSKDGAFYKEFISDRLPKSNSLDEVITHFR